MGKAKNTTTESILPDSSNIEEVAVGDRVEETSTPDVEEVNMSEQQQTKASKAVLALDSGASVAFSKCDDITSVIEKLVEDNKIDVTIVATRTTKFVPFEGTKDELTEFILLATNPVGTDEIFENVSPLAALLPDELLALLVIEARQLAISNYGTGLVHAYSPITGVDEYFKRSSFKIFKGVGVVMTTPMIFVKGASINKNTPEYIFFIEMTGYNDSELTINDMRKILKYASSH